MKGRCAYGDVTNINLRFNSFNSDIFLDENEGIVWRVTIPLSDNHKKRTQTLKANQHRDILHGKELFGKINMKLICTSCNLQVNRFEYEDYTWTRPAWIKKEWKNDSVLFISEKVFRKTTTHKDIYLMFVILASDGCNELIK